MSRAGRLKKEFSRNFKNRIIRKRIAAGGGVSVNLEISGASWILGAMLILVIPMNWLLAAVTAAVFHELSHGAAILLLGAQIHGLKILPDGIRMETSPMTAWQEIFCSLAGPAGSLLLVLLGRHTPRIALCALVQGCYNLLPVYPLDGGRALRCLLEWFLSPKTAKKVERVLVCAVLAAGCPVILWLDRRLSMDGILILMVAFGIARGIFRKIPCKETVLRVQ